MNKKTKYLSYFLSILTISFIVEIAYVSTQYKFTKEDISTKNNYTKVVGLPDLAISTEAMYIRHRTLSNTFDIFKDDPTIYTYFPSTFAISHSNIHNNISRIQYD